MSYPIFVFHELVVRLAEINPIIGKYLANEPGDDVFTLTTFNGTLIIPTHFLQLQYENPEQITVTDLSILANNFRSYPH